MKVYAKETEKPYGYLLVDNQPKTPTEKQVVAEVFENCHCYPKITSCTKTVSEADKPELVSRKRPIDPPLVKNKHRKQSEQKQKKLGTIKANPVKQNVKSKRRRKQQGKTGYTSTLKLSPDRDSGNEKRVNFDEEPIHLTQHQVNAMARRAVKARGSSFGPKMVYD